MKVRGTDQKEHNLKPEQIWWKQEVQTNGKIIYTISNQWEQEVQTNGIIIIEIYIEKTIWDNSFR